MSDYLATSELMQLCKKFEGKRRRTRQSQRRLVFRAGEGPGSLTTLRWRVRCHGSAARRALAAGPANATIARRQGTGRREELVGYTKIELDPKEKTVRLTIPGMQLDLGGIAKGYAADEVLKSLAKFEICQRRCVAAGGDIAVSGTARGRKAGRSISPRCRVQRSSDSCI